MSKENGNGAENSASAPQGPIRSRRELRGSRANIRQAPVDSTPLRAEGNTGAIPALHAHVRAPEPVPPSDGVPWQIRAEDRQSKLVGDADIAEAAASVEDRLAPVDSVHEAAGTVGQEAGRGLRFAPVEETNGIPDQSNGIGGAEALLGKTKAPNNDAGVPLLPGSDRPRTKKRKKRTGRSIAAFLVVVLALAGLGYVGTKMVMNFLNSNSSASVTDYPGPGSGEVNVVIPEGASGAAIARVLVDAGVTASVERTVAVLANHPDATSIQPGTYVLKKQMRADAAVAALMDPANRADTGLTIPEGYVLAQVKARMVEIGGFDAAEVEAAFKDTTALGLPEVAKGNLEGWLAPATYEVGPSDTPVTLLKQMVALQRSRLEAAGVAEADFQTVLIKASILEREVNIDEYLPKVARVIENRLKDAEGETRGLLQMDSTVLYGLGQVGGVPTQEQLAIDTPFNTYMHPGLPPAPIASPGERAIEVALAPAEGTWLYFVSINLDTGETRFASTLEEHQENVKLYRSYCETSDRC